MSKLLLGQILLERNIITQEQLDIALKKQKEEGGLLGAILLGLGFVDEEAIFLPFLSDQLGVKHVKLKDIDVSQDVIHQIPTKFATFYKVVPISLEKGVLSLATSKPLDLQILDEIGLVVRNKIKPVLAMENDVLDAIRKYYGLGAETIDQMMDDVVEEVDLDDEGMEEIESEASISKFLNQIFIEGHKKRATDIHFEPFEDELQIRYRIDGMLYDAKVPKNLKHFKDSINSRIKILSNLNIAEKRLPQDGRFKLRLGEVDLDMRVSFIPTPFGESVVLRLLNATKLYTFDELGLSTREKSILEKLILKPHGIVFVTGPTGSGKTTTLYSCLSRVNTEDKKVITIEDPIEYQLRGITQIQVNSGVGLTFAQGLRSMLRQDPDIMMVGEVRDIETATIAIQVALTGHLVFSTLHTNDAASGVTRLLDMGVEPYLITSTVECFIAQRLIRVLCPYCKYKVGDNKASDFEDFKGEIVYEDVVEIYEGKGCEKCNFTGYMGRKPVYEFLLVDDHIRRLIIDRSTSGEIKKRAIDCGMSTLMRSGWNYVKQGITTPEEVLRIAQKES